MRDAHEMLRNPVDFAILCQLMAAGSQTRGQLVDALELNPKTVQFHLDELRSTGLIDAAPLADPDGLRHRLTYQAKSTEVRRRYEILGGALGL